MHEVFLDTSWTIHAMAVNTSAYRSLFQSPRPTTSQQQSQERLRTYLSQTPQYIDDLEDASTKLGQLTQCKYTSVDPGFALSAVEIKVSLIELEYAGASQAMKFILTPHAVFSRADATVVKRILAFLGETYGISLDVLRLSASMLLSSLSNYVSDLVSPLQSDEALRLMLLKCGVGNLKLKIAVSGMVSQAGLRGVDVDVPYETVSSLIAAPTPLGSGSTLASDEGDTFLRNLRHWTTEQTGLKLPLDVVENDERESEMPWRVTRITGAGFAMGAEGKIKFAAKAVGGAGDNGFVVRNANVHMTRAVLDEAKKRGTPT